MNKKSKAINKKRKEDYLSNTNKNIVFVVNNSVEVMTSLQATLKYENLPACEEVYTYTCNKSEITTFIDSLKQALETQPISEVATKFKKPNDCIMVKDVKEQFRFLFLGDISKVHGIYPKSKFKVENFTYKLIKNKARHQIIGIFGRKIIKKQNLTKSGLIESLRHNKIKQFVLDFNKDSDYDSHCDLSYEKLFKLYIYRNVTKFGKYKHIQANIKGKVFVYRNFNQLVEDISDLVPKDEYTLKGFESYESANKHNKLIMEKTYDVDNYFVDVSLRDSTGQFRIVQRNIELYRSDRFKMPTDTESSYMELLAVYNASLLRKYGCKDKSIYTDSLSVIELLKGENKELVKTFTNYIEKHIQSSNNHSKKLAKELQDAYKYLLKNNYKIEFWNQKTLGTNPAHFILDYV